MVTTTSSPTTSSAAPTTTAMTDDEAAIAAVTKYYDAFNRALKTMDPTEMTLLAGPACSVCEQAVENLRRDRASGRTYQGGASYPSEIKVVQRKDADHYLIAARVTTEAMEIRDGTGKVVDTFNAVSGPKSFVVARVKGIWTFDAVV